MRQAFLPFARHCSHISLLVVVGIAAGVAPGLASAQGSRGESPHQKIISQIQRHGFKKVAVLPRAIVQKMDLVNAHKESVVSKNTLGPVATLLAGELNDELVNAPNKGFEVVSESTVLRAIAGRKLSEVDQDEFWNLILKKTGADAGVYETIIDAGPEDGGKSGAASLGVSVQVINTKSKEVVGSQTGTYDKTLSDAAYAGESFVVHEWDADRLTSPGLIKEPYFGVGASRERELYANLRGGLGHPLQREGYPYGVAVVVDGQVREPVEIDGNLYVPLKLGEKYQLQIWNKGEKPVFAGVYVDGLNTIGQGRERPSDTDTNRTWWLRPTGARAATIEGWFNHDLENNNRAKVNEFAVVGAEESLANTTMAPGEETFGAANGMITTIFYTYGTDGIPLTKSTRPPPASSIGTGKGAAIDSRVSEYETEKKLKGIMLSAMTIYYRTPEQLEQLRRELKDQGTLVSVEAKPGDSANSIKRPAESQINRSEAEQLGIPVKPDQEKSTEATTPKPVKEESEQKEPVKASPPKDAPDQAKRKDESPKKADKPKGLAPGSDKP